MKKVNTVLMSLAFIIMLSGCVSSRSVSVSSNSVSVSVPQASDAEETTEFDTSPEVVDNNNLKMTISYGYEKHAKYGRHMQVSVNIANKGADFLGKIQVVVPNESLGNIMYEKEVAVAADSSKSIALAIPLNSYSDKFEFKLVTEHNKVVSKIASRVNVLTNSSLIFAGVLSDDYNSLSYLNSDIMKTFNLTEDTLSEDVMGLDLLDIIIINDFSTSKLSENQYNAIKSWVNTGGTLVIGTGGSHKKTLEIFNDEFMTGKIGDISLKELKMSSQTGIQKEILGISIDNSLTVLKDEYALIEQVKSGKGIINIATFDLGLNSSDWKTIGTDIRETIVNNISISRKNKIESEAMGYRNSNWSLYNVLSDISAGKLPNIGLIAAVLGIYILIAGPILYIILKRIDKRNLMWVSLPVCAFGFSVIILLIGTRTRFTQPFINYLSVMTVNDNTADEEVYFSVTAPYNRKYSMLFDNKYGVQVMNQNSYYYGYGGEVNTDDYKVAFKYKADTTSIEMSNFSAFTSNYFSLSDYYEINSSVDADIVCTRDGISGNVKNNLGYDLENAVLLTNGMLINLGTIKDGEVRSVDGNKNNMIMINRDYNSIVDEITGTNAFSTNTTSEEKQYASKKNYALTYYLFKYMEEESSGTYIVGFNKDALDVNFTKDLDYDAYGIRLYKIAVDVNYQKDNIVYLPNINIYISNAYEGYDMTYGNIYGETAIIEYDFGQDSNISEIYYETYGDIFNGKYYEPYPSFYGQIEFFNYDTQDFERVFNDKDTETDLEKYLGDTNILKVRFIKSMNTSGYYDNMTLPIISAIKEVE